MPSQRKRARCADSDDEAVSKHSHLKAPTFKRIKHSDSDSVEFIDVDGAIEIPASYPGEEGAISPRSSEGHSAAWEKSVQITSKAGALVAKQVLSNEYEQVVMTGANTSIPSEHSQQAPSASMTKGLCEGSSNPVGLSDVSSVSCVHN
jgi:hypothetical protein